MFGGRFGNVSLGGAVGPGIPITGQTGRMRESARAKKARLRYQAKMIENATKWLTPPSEADGALAEYLAVQIDPHIHRKGRSNISPSLPKFPSVPSGYERVSMSLNGVTSTTGWGFVAISPTLASDENAVTYSQLDTYALETFPVTNAETGVTLAQPGAAARFQSADFGDNLRCRCLAAGTRVSYNGVEDKDGGDIWCVNQSAGLTVLGFDSSDVEAEPSGVNHPFLGSSHEALSRGKGRTWYGAVWQPTHEEQFRYHGNHYGSERTREYVTGILIKSSEPSTPFKIEVDFHFQVIGSSSGNRPRKVHASPKVDAAMAALSNIDPAHRSLASNGPVDFSRVMRQVIRGVSEGASNISADMISRILSGPMGAVPQFAAAASPSRLPVMDSVGNLLDSPIVEELETSAASAEDLVPMLALAL